MARAWVEVVNDRTVEVKAGCASAVEKAIARAVLDIEAKAKRNVRDMNAIDTGALMNSIYASTTRRSNYAKAQGAASAEAAKGSRKTRSKKKDQAKTFQMQPEIIPSRHEGIVAVGAEYGEKIHEGTTSMPGRPFLGNAAQEIIAVFDEVVADMINKELK